MNGVGKYIRHFLAVIIGTSAAAGARWLEARFGMQFDAEQVRGFADALAGTLTMGVLVWGYAWAEKFLKRYRRLDPEGAVDLERLKGRAA